MKAWFKQLPHLVKVLNLSCATVMFAAVFMWLIIAHKLAVILVALGVAICLGVDTPIKDFDL